MSKGVLIAGIGNVFFGDDGFGPAVIKRLARRALPGATFVDFGIRGMHLAYEMTSGYDRAILIDAVPRGGVPGTLYAIDPLVDLPPGTPDAHGMDVTSVFAFVRLLEAPLPPTTIVGCEPERIDERMSLSRSVARSVGPAAALVRRMVEPSPAAPKRREKEPV